MTRKYLKIPKLRSLTCQMLLETWYFFDDSNVFNFTWPIMKLKRINLYFTVPWVQGKILYDINKIIHTQKINYFILNLKTIGQLKQKWPIFLSNHTQLTGSIYLTLLAAINDMAIYIWLTRGYCTLCLRLQPFPTTMAQIRLTNSTHCPF